MMKAKRTVHSFQQLLTVGNFGPWNIAFAEVDLIQQSINGVHFEYFKVFKDTKCKYSIYSNPDLDSAFPFVGILGFKLLTSKN